MIKLQENESDVVEQLLGCLYHGGYSDGRDATVKTTTTIASVGSVKCRLLLTKRLRSYHELAALTAA
jgi:hypothetical protein